MAESIAALLSFPPAKGTKISPKEYDTQISTYTRALNQIPSTTWTKSVDKKNVLDLLDPSVNSLPYLFALNAQLKAADTNEQEQLVFLVGRANEFLNSFDPIQVRYEGAQWYSLLETLVRLHEGQGTQDITPIVSAILRLDPTAGTFTTLHLRIVRLALAAGIPSQALPILDKDIYAYPQNLAKNVPEDLLSDTIEFSNSFINNRSGFTLKVLPEFILEYYLLGAQVYLALGRFARARLFLEYILLTPSVQHAVSAFQAEAYKKWVLLGLLAEGRTYGVPRTMDQSVLKSVRSLSKAYDALAEDFEKRDWKKFQAEADKGDREWQEDGNHRLVTEAAQALLRYRVLDQRKTFAALPVTRLAGILELSVDAVLELLVGMASLGRLPATVSSPDANAVLRFHTEDDSTAAESLETQTARIQALIAYVKDADRRLQLTREYVDNQKRLKRSGGPDGDLADAMDLTYDIQNPVEDEVGDEDIME